MVEVRQATKDDVEAISAIVGEIQAYYGAEYVPGDPGQIRAALFGESPAATLLLAVEGDDVLGMASYSRLWPAAGADTLLFLKELFVRESARRRGVARSLMGRLRAVAAELGCSRIEWTADTANPAALALYEALGARPREGKVFYRTPV